VKGQWIPRHATLAYDPVEAETLLRLLRAVDADAEFPLNEMEQQVVDATIGVLDDGSSPTATR